VDNAHEAFFNGAKLGGTGSFPPSYRNGLGETRAYDIPPEKIRVGEWNLVALRVYDQEGRGGFKGEAPWLLNGRQGILLSGEWQFRTGDDETWAGMGTEDVRGNALHHTVSTYTGVQPITRWHLQNARQQLASSPQRKGKQQLDEFLETELSREPQVGFVVGVGANDTSGVLLPIASTLVYRMYPEKIVVTGAVSTSSAPGAELDLAVQMTHQSSREALTLVESYLQSLLPQINMSRLLGEFLDGYSIHHQLLSASYNVGGPSAGFALAINTLSVLINLPVLNDFGITGAPWIKGARKGEIGASVLIGGHRKKTEKVLQYLQRMYMPVQNYLDMESEVLDSYRLQGKDVLPVNSFSSLVPEVFYFGEKHHQLLQNFFKGRIDMELRQDTFETTPAAREESGKRAAELRVMAEEKVRQRLLAIQDHMNKQGSNYDSMDQIYASIEAT
jgi:hypothetical protein